jgi:DNA-binding transcriptional regulator YdaS (Cro superfamily)
MHALRKWRLSLPKPMRSYKAVGALLGVSGTQVMRYELGQRRVPPEKVARYSKITGIPKTGLRPDVFPVRRRRVQQEQLLAVD